MSATPSQQDVDAAIRRVDDLIDSIGDEINQPINATADDGTSVTGRQVQHGDFTYNVLAAPGNPSVQLQFPYNATQDLAVARARSDGGQQVHGGPAQVNVGPQQIEQSKQELRDAVDDDDLAEMRQGVLDRASVPPYSLKFEMDEEAIYGFAVKADLYLYAEDVSVREFGEKAQGIVSLGWKAQSYLAHEYDIGGLADTDASQGPRGFQ